MANRNGYIVRQRDFSGGEIVEHAKRRDDEAVVRAGLRSARNVQILSSGALDQRPGREAMFQEDGRADEVRVAPGTIYRLCFGEGTLTIRDDDGAVVARAWGYAWTAATSNQIVWDIFNRDVVICFPGQRMKIARWDGGTEWTFLDWAATETAAGRRLVPFQRFAAPGVTMALSALTGDVDVTFSDDVLQPGHVGTRMRYYDKQITITSVTNGTTGTATINEVLRQVFSTDFTDDVTDQFSVGDVVETTGGAKRYVAEVGTPGSDDATLIRLNGVNAGAGQIFIGPSGEAEIQGPNAAPTAAPAITVWDEEVMNDFRGWPRSVTTDQNRLIFCDFPGVPEGIGWSASGDHLDFATGLAEDADPTDAMFEYAPKKARVYHLRDGADEFVFTDQGLYYIPISESNPLRPGSVAFRRIPGAAASQVEPVSTAQGLVYVNAGLNRVLAIVGTGQTAQPYVVRPASDLNSHLFNSIVCIEVYEGDGDPPDELVFVVNGDGTVVVGRYQPGKDWPGWVPWSGEGDVKWISALAESVLFSVDYDSGGLVERLVDERYMDAVVDYDAIPAALGTGAQPAVAIPASQGTLIGDMTSGAGLAAAFDNITNISSISLVTSQTGTDTLGRLTLPSGIQAGDLLVWWQRGTSGGLPTTDLPGGFIAIANFTATNTRGIPAYKIALGNESGTTVTGVTGTVDNDMMLYVFRANLPLTAVAIGDVATAGVDTDPPDQVVNISGLSTPLIVFGCYASSGAVDPRTFSPAKDGEITSSSNAYLAYKIYNSSPADTTIGMDDEGNANLLASFYIQVAAPSAQKSGSTTAAVGKAFGQPMKVVKTEVWPPTGVGFTDQATLTITVRASQGSPPINYETDGALIATLGPIADTTSMQTLTSFGTTNNWDYAWVLVTISTGAVYIAEVKFYSPGLTHGSGELWFLAGETLWVMDGGRVIGQREIDGDGEVMLEEGDAFTDETFGHRFGDVVMEPFIAHVGPGQSVGQTIVARQISDCAVAVQNSTGFRVEHLKNPKTMTWEEIKTRGPYDAGEDEGPEPTPREEVVTFKVNGTEHDPRVRVVKDYPGPLRMLEMDFEVGR